MVSAENITFFNSQEFRNKLKLTLSRLSGSFMLPIATLAVTAMFLSMGSFLEGISSYQWLQKVGFFIKSISYPILLASPILFCVAFAMSFCDNDATYVWSALVAYLVFIVSQHAFITKDSNDYQIIFKGLGRSNVNYLVSNIFGLNILNTSIFGSFLIGAVLMPYIRRNFSDVQLPTYLSFFSGKRLIPLISAIFSVMLSFLFLLFWPWVGKAFSWLGHGIGRAPSGIDSFLFGVIEKSLIPFGLHHMFYAPLWYSSLGGDAAYAAQSGTFTNGTNGTNGIKTAEDIMKALKEGTAYSGGWQGDSFIGASIISLPGNQISSSPVMSYFANTLKLNVGRFTQGKYPIMMFALPAAGLAMIESASPGDRKAVRATVVPAILNSLILGITEPMEFTFLFALPKLFYGFHAVCCGLSFMLMNICGAHIPSIFSGGILEFLFMGVLPLQKGTNPQIVPLVGIILAPAYFWVFKFLIGYGKLPIPGVEAAADGGPTQGGASSSGVPEPTRKLALALGGWDNLGKISNCASRLRYDIVDRSRVDEAALKGAGALAVKWIGDNHVQIIVGPKAESINAEMVKWRGEEL